MKKKIGALSFNGRVKEYWVKSDRGAIVGRFRTKDAAESLALSYQGKPDIYNQDVFEPVTILEVYIDEREFL
tara:strand:+ start:23359 stop:23574 length:216 start_codon:yes stop_codon:yes gene_type:complete